ncbi:MAG TPA: hypothetical protein VKO83_05825 [Steroidobacteraceae bacterium]|nr:hypothetical protein [Steroidobacteraceae bacterium]
MTQPYLRDVWYMAGWSEELADRPLARRLFDRAIVLCPGQRWRRAGGLRVRRRIKAMLAREQA